MKRKIIKNEIIILKEIRIADISDTFDRLKRKISGQRFKDNARLGWEFK